MRSVIYKNRKYESDEIPGIVSSIISDTLSDIRKDAKQFIQYYDPFVEDMNWTQRYIVYEMQDKISNTMEVIEEVRKTPPTEEQELLYKKLTFEKARLELIDEKLKVIEEQEWQVQHKEMPLTKNEVEEATQRMQEVKQYANQEKEGLPKDLHILREIQKREQANYPTTSKDCSTTSKDEQLQNTHSQQFSIFSEINVPCTIL